VVVTPQFAAVLLEVSQCTIWDCVTRDWMQGLSEIHGKEAGISFMSAMFWSDHVQ
jgi:hypothetical protein